MPPSAACHKRRPMLHLDPESAEAFRVLFLFKLFPRTQTRLESTCHNLWHGDKCNAKHNVKWQAASITATATTATRRQTDSSMSTLPPALLFILEFHEIFGVRRSYSLCSSSSACPACCDIKGSCFLGHCATPTNEQRGTRALRIRRRVRHEKKNNTEKHEQC